jgi:hypothetical protein
MMMDPGFKTGRQSALPPAERAVAHKEMKLAVGTSAHHAAVKKHALASEAHAKAVTIAQKAATRARR